MGRILTVSSFTGVGLAWFLSEWRGKGFSSENAQWHKSGTFMAIYWENVCSTLVNDKKDNRPRKGLLSFLSLTKVEQSWGWTVGFTKQIIPSLDVLSTCTYIEPAATRHYSGTCHWRVERGFYRVCPYSRYCHMVIYLFVRVLYVRAPIFYSAKSAASIWFEIWGSWIRVKKFRFSMKISEKFGFFRQPHKKNWFFSANFRKNFDFFQVISQKISIFQGKFSENFDFFRQFHKKFWFSRKISEKFWFF